MELDRDGTSESQQHQRDTEKVAGPPVTHGRIDPHTEMGAGERIERAGWGNSNRDEQEERTETEWRETKQGQTQTRSITTSPSKTRGHMQRRSMKTASREEPPLPHGPAAPVPPGTLSASRRMSRGSCCLAPQRPNSDHVQDFILLG